MDSVWVFNGARSNFPSGVFSQRDIAEEWIRAQSLTGTLTKYPIDVGAYEWAVTRGHFEPKRPDQQTPEFIGRFSDASQEHYHYEDGQRG
jgi:hypothetical protein